MCGIALIIAGASINLSSLPPDSGINRPSPPCHTSQVKESESLADELQAVLKRRGPDYLGRKEIYLHLELDRSSDTLVCDNTMRGFQVHEVVSSCKKSEITSEQNGSHGLQVSHSISNAAAKMLFVGSVLHLRGTYPAAQPLEDVKNNFLLFNGEIFDGMDIGDEKNDTEALLHALDDCCSCHSCEHLTSCQNSEKRKTVPEVLSSLRGPWTFIYWQESSRTIWFGRDAFGRRSLLVHLPTMSDPHFILSSISLPSSITSTTVEAEDMVATSNNWEELPCGIYSISFEYGPKSTLYNKLSIVGNIKKHDWTDALLKILIKWERKLVNPSMNGHYLIAAPLEDKVRSPAQKVLAALKDAVQRRTVLNTISQGLFIKEGKCFAPIAVLFSGGLDSMLIAALLNQCLHPSYEIDLLSVSFDGQHAPDRISAISGVRELQRIAPTRRWRLVEIDADLSDLSAETRHVMSLINPARTYMDLNIGMALWLASGGDGWVVEESSHNGEKDHSRFKYRSVAKVLLVGSGADEQCGGYGRYRTKYRLGSWSALQEEMRLDMQRIWKRNLGRDDRCIADNGKEARFPFLDEDVIKTLLDIPLWEIADLDKPSGIGDKKILREVARILGLEVAAAMPKRAIQFGSRIARESNRKNFGSNRAANMASAGSVIIRPL